MYLKIDTQANRDETYLTEVRCPTEVRCLTSYKEPLRDLTKVGQVSACTHFLPGFPT